MTRMHNFVRFLFSLRKYVMIMIHWKFHNRWLILNNAKWTDKVSPLLTGLVTHVYESSTMKFSVDHNYDVFSQKKRKSSKIMLVSHNYDSSTECYVIGISKSLTLNFCVGVSFKCQNFWLNEISNKISYQMMCISSIFEL